MILTNPASIARRFLGTLGVQLVTTTASLADGHADVAVVIHCVKKIDLFLSLVADAKAAVYSGELQRCLLAAKRDAPLSENTYRGLALLGDYCIYYHEKNEQLNLVELNLLRQENGKRSIGSQAHDPNKMGGDCSLSCMWRWSAAAPLLGAQLAELESLCVRYYANRSNNPQTGRLSVRLQWEKTTTYYRFFGTTEKFARSLPAREEALHSLLLMRQQLHLWRESLDSSMQFRQFSSTQLALSNIALLTCMQNRFFTVCELIDANSGVNAKDPLRGSAVEASVAINHACHVARKVIGFVSSDDRIAVLLCRYLNLLSRVCWYGSVQNMGRCTGASNLVLLARLVFSIASCLGDIRVNLYRNDDFLAISFRFWESNLSAALALASQLRREIHTPVEWYTGINRAMIAYEWESEMHKMCTLLERPGPALSAELIDDLFYSCNRLQKISALASNKILSHALLEATIVLTVMQEQRLFIDPTPQIMLADFVSVLRQERSINQALCKRAEKKLMLFGLRVKEWVWYEQFTALKSSKTERNLPLSIVDAEDGITLSQWPKYLAENIRRIVISSQTISECLFASREFDEMNSALILELRVLWMGSKKLSVYRITHVSELLMRMHQSFSIATDAIAYLSCKTLLLEAHKELRKSLNQAAARKRVTFPRDLLNELYGALDSTRTTRADEVVRTAFLKEASQRAAMIKRYCEDLSAEDPSLLGPVLASDSTKPEVVSETKIPLLRELHTLKGSAQMFGENQISTTCHQCERLVLRRFDATVISECGVEDGAQPASGEYYLSALVEQLQNQVALLVSKHCTTGRDSAVLADEQPIVAAGPPTNSTSAVDYRVMELISKISADHNAMLHVISQGNPYKSDTKIALLESLLHEHKVSIVQLKESMTLSAKKSFSSITSRFDTLVKMYSLRLEKEIHFVVENAGIEVEGNVVELLVAPLEHLLRNAIDHGIELPRDRLANGKSERGVIRLRFACVNPRQLSVEVSDDGAGIAKNAQEQHNDSLEMLCRVGFSTKATVSLSSGHGLGLAAVKQALSYLRAQLSMTSSPHRGTSFQIVVPLN
jgi:HPt (histidine-containing phosphotransfer) domain-containing protein